MSFKFIDLFAGVGGIRTPFSELGGSCVFSSEIDKFARKTYQANWDEEVEVDNFFSIKKIKTRIK